MKKGIYSTGGHGNKQEKEKGRQGGQVYTKKAEHLREESSGEKLRYKYKNDAIQHDLKLEIVGRKEMIYKRAYNRPKIFNSD